MKIILLGDIAFTGILSTQPEKNQWRYKEVIPILNSAALVFANLEVPVKADESRNEYKNHIHYSLPEPIKNLLKLLNIECVSLANNHIYDCKMSGLKATIQILDELGVSHTGAGWLSEHVEPAIIGNNGYKIGFLAYVDKTTNPKTERFPELYINYLEIDTVLKDIGRLAENTDKVIVSIHWGTDYSYYPTPKQIRLAHLIIDAGADILMGHHSHTFQPYEKYKHGYIFYSLGGLTFGDYMKNGKLQSLFRKTKRSAVVFCDLLDMKLTFLPTKELKANIIQIDKRNYPEWSKMRWRFYKIKHSYSLMERLFEFQEKVLYRIYEYFFGYYQNPLKRLFMFSNYIKIKRLFNGLRVRK